MIVAYPPDPFYSRIRTPRQRPECNAGAMPGPTSRQGIVPSGWGGGRPEKEKGSWGGGLTVLRGGISGADPLRVGTVPYAGLPPQREAPGLTSIKASVNSC